MPIYVQLQPLHYGMSVSFYSWLILSLKLPINGTKTGLRKTSFATGQHCIVKSEWSVNIVLSSKTLRQDNRITVKCIPQIPYRLTILLTITVDVSTYIRTLNVTCPTIFMQELNNYQTFISES